jgi:[ribosomal protein S5]-alanine N-acetyltransferase
MELLTIHTQRLTLRLIDPSVFHWAFKELSDAEKCTLFQFKEDAELHAAKERYAKGIESWWFKFAWFQIFRTSDMKYLGWCGFHTIVVNHQRGEVGYVLEAEEERNKGYMGEALKAVLKYGFNELNLNRIEALTSPTNEISQKLLYANGFMQEGELRRHYLKDGVFENSVFYGLLKEEFEQLY